MGEILHLQYGNLSNFIMAHYWNIQDELIKYGHTDYVHSRLYVESGSGLYVPRTLIFDMKDMYGYYAPPDIEEEIKNADPNFLVCEAAPVAKSPFTKYLDGDASVFNEDNRDDELEMSEAELKKYDEKMNAQKKNDKVIEEDKADRKDIKPEEEKKSYAEQLNHLKKLYEKFNFEKHCNYWIDYSQTSYNSSNRIPVSLYEDIDDMADYQNGFAFAEENFSFREECEDGFRHMLEKASLVSGLVVAYESNDSFAGITAATLRNYKDEIPKCPVIGFSSVNPFIKKTKDNEEPWQALNNLMSMKDVVTGLMDVVVPFDFPQMSKPNTKSIDKVDMASKYHMSALPVCAIDSIVHPFCRKSHLAGGMREWVNYFSFDPALKIVHLRQSLPFLWFASEKLDEAISKTDMKDMHHFSPSIAKAKHAPYFSFNFLRANYDIKATAVDECLTKIKDVSKCMKNTFFDENILLPISYPRFFSPLIMATGKSLTVPQKDPPFVSQIPYYANLFLTYKTGKQLNEALKKISERQFWLKKLISKGKLIVDEWDEVKSEVSRIAESYGSLKNA